MIAQSGAGDSRPLRGRALEPYQVAVVAPFHAYMRDQTAAGRRRMAPGAQHDGGTARAEIADLDFADVDLRGEVVRVHGKEGTRSARPPVKAAPWRRSAVGHRAGAPGVSGGQGARAQS